MSRGHYAQVTVPGATWRATLDLETSLVTVRVHVHGRGLAPPVRFHWSSGEGIHFRPQSKPIDQTTEDVIKILKQLSERLLARTRN